MTVIYSYAVYQYECRQLQLISSCILVGVETQELIVSVR